MRTSKARQISRKLAEEGMVRADKYADIKWKEAARREIWNSARKKRWFTSEDIIASLEIKGFKKRNYSAIGALMSEAKNNGWIRVDGFNLSKRPSRHMAPVRVWRSLIYKK